MGDHPSVGDTRLAYLDLANKCLGAGDSDQAYHFMDAYIATLSSDVLSLKEIERSFEEIERKKLATWLLVVQRTERIDSRLQAEERRNDSNSLALMVLKDKLAVCWRVALSCDGFKSG